MCLLQKGMCGSVLLAWVDGGLWRGEGVKAMLLVGRNNVIW